ncbi:MAG: aspartate aminotransferase family protein [Actinomycetota bacterium]
MEAVDALSWTDDDYARLDALIDQQEAAFFGRQRRSADLLATAQAVLAGGATSSWQIARPQMIWMSHGEGSHVVDADGIEYVDLNGGYGVGLMGHAHPAVVRAVQRRVERGTHFAQPTEDAIAVATDLARRWGLPLWRFGNSGTETTMDAIHLVRAITGRDRFLKVEGCYHGHHDSVMVSVYNDIDEIGPAHRPTGVPSGTGLPRAITDLTTIVPFNDLDALERVLAEHEGDIAGMIVEPIMMNAGIIPPVEGYLEGARDLLHRHGALLVFDEVKTGLTAGPGGATQLLGVEPDIVCLAKALGGGIPCGALGGTEEVMAHITEGDYEQVGTFNGNPLTMAAARAVLETLDDAAYDHLARLQKMMTAGVEQIIDQYELPAHVVSVGAKGCVTFRSDPVRNYRDFLGLDDRPSHVHWLFQHAGRVFLPPWGKAEQWLISVQHTEEDVASFLDNFETMAEAVRR